jgi:hypothetical protein
MPSLSVAWQWILTMCSTSVLTSLPAGYHLTIDPQLATHWPWLNRLVLPLPPPRPWYRDRVENIVSDSSCIVTGWFIATATCFPNLCLATDYFSCESIQAFSSVTISIWIYVNINRHCLRILSDIILVSCVCVCVRRGVISQRCQYQDQGSANYGPRAVSVS